MEEIMKIYY